MDGADETYSGELTALPPGSPSVTPTADAGADLLKPIPKRRKINDIHDVRSMVLDRLELLQTMDADLTAFETNEMFCKLVRVFCEIERVRSDGEALGIAHFQLKGKRRTG